MLGGLTKNFDRPSVNTFPGNFRARFSDNALKKEPTLVAHLLVALRFREALEKRGAEEELPPFFRQSLSRKFVRNIGEESLKELKLSPPPPNHIVACLERAVS